MASDDDGYAIGAGITGLLVGIPTFFGCWIYAVVEYGWFLGLAFGWIPSLIIAYIAGFVAGALWPLLLIGVIALLYMAFKN